MDIAIGNLRLVTNKIGVHGEQISCGVLWGPDFNRRGWALGKWNTWGLRRVRTVRVAVYSNPGIGYTGFMWRQ